MTDPDRWLAVDARLAAVGQDTWAIDSTLDRGDQEGPRIRVESSGARGSHLHVTREHEQASAADIEFIGHAPRDVRRLVDQLRGEVELAADEIAEIESRLSKASPGPWRAFLKTGGGVGGDSVIWITEGDDEPDLYLWLEDRPAPDTYYDFVASARQDIAELLRALGRGSGEGTS